MEQSRFLKQLNSRRSSRGAALITVLIVVSIVSLFGLLSMSVAYTSFRMKNVDMESTEVFYGAEKVLEELSAELQNIMSDCHASAYTAVMSNYGNYTEPAAMKVDYETHFLNALKLELDNNSDGFYELTNENGHIATNFVESVDKIVDKYESMGITVEFSTKLAKNYLDSTGDSLYLRNLRVRYEAKGYYNEITTDIRMDAPNMTFSIFSEVPDISNYALAVGGKLSLAGTSQSNVTGAVGIGTSDAENEEGKSVIFNAGATLNLENAELTTSGSIDLTSGSVFIADEDTTVWTEGFNTYELSNKLALLGKTYVKDDLTINGEGNQLVLGGHYFGYSGSQKTVEGEQGVEVTADSSSAIIINGKSTSMNLSRLDSLILAGTSYVGTKGESIKSLVGVGVEMNIPTQDNVFMGDSIAVKSNQLIYMVPTECEGIKNNPMTYAEYRQLEVISNWEEIALNTYLTGLGRSIASYGDVEIEPVFTSKAGGAVYLYLQFESAQAASEFFLDCYGNTENGKKVEEFLDNYISAFEFLPDEGVNIMSAGNYLMSLTADQYTYVGSTGEIDQISLENSYLQMQDKAQFNTIVNEEAIVGDYSAQAGDIHFIVVDNEGKDTYDVPYYFKGILIATGDVRVTSNDQMSGLIICKGDLEVINLGMNLDADADVIAKALNLKDESGLAAKSFLNGYYDVTTESADEAVVTDIRDCISFENWKSE